MLGAGELGTAVLTSLANKKTPTTTISVLLRPSAIESLSPYKAADISALRALGISILPGDIASSAIRDLSALFKPYDLIISCLGFASGPGSQLKIARAVLDAGAKTPAPWQFGVDYDIIERGSAQDSLDEQLDVRDLLRAQEPTSKGDNGTEWIIISTGMFTSFLFESCFGVVDLEGEGGHGRGVVRALGGWDNKVTVTTPEDIGQLTAVIVLKEPKARNEVVYTAGETITYRSLADLVDQFRGEGNPVRREEWSLGFLKEELKRRPEDTVQKYRVVFAEGKGVAWDLKNSFNWKNGIGVDDVKTWMANNLARKLNGQYPFRTLCTRTAVCLYTVPRHP